jgi:integrase
MLETFISDLGDIAGVPDCYCHRFRHQFAVAQLLNGTSEFVLLRLMGHTSPESLKPYTRAMTSIQARKAAPSIVDQLKKHPNR